MSDNFLRLIPSSPFFVPDEKAINEAIKLVREDFPLAKDVITEIYDSPNFIDQGSNWVRVVCPNCNSEIDGEWWQTAMDQAYEHNFQNLDIKVPCCGIETSLNDLRYESPAGFAKFKIEVHNPGKDVSESHISRLETILGTSLRKIWAHY